MLLTAPDRESVLYVAERAVVREGSGVRPADIADTVMARPELTWVVWHDGLPAAVIGGTENAPGRWLMFCFSTDAFPKVVLPLTRFVRRTMLPLLFNDLGAIRLEAASHRKNVEVHKWLGLCGAVKVGERDGHVVFAIDKRQAQV